ncbi:unnamed protein product [Closterium sp. NIES-64]|nr:unnamed protein product [Closterium sp. NIES-64]
MSGTYVTCQVKRLSGVVDDCCCEYETVDELNSHVLQPLLTQLVNTTFFKYFKVGSVRYCKVRSGFRGASRTCVAAAADSSSTPPQPIPPLPAPSPARSSLVCVTVPSGQTTACATPENAPWGTTRFVCGVTVPSGQTTACATPGIVRLWCDCPFWPDDGMCHSRDCSVGECKDDEVPPALRCPSPPAPSLLPADVDEPRDADLDPSADESASAESAAGSVDRTVDRSAFQAWVEADNPWTSDDESDTGEKPSQVYVNLALNPERYTGYGGDSARRIWQAIYQESCFQDGTRDECTERRVLYRLISGLHQAISVHVAASQIWDSAAGKSCRVSSWEGEAGIAELQSEQLGSGGPNITIFHHRVAKFPSKPPSHSPSIAPAFSHPFTSYFPSPLSPPTIQWGPNITIFHHRVAKFPERLANLYFTFLFVLRRGHQADFLSRASYDTGNPLEDQQTAALVQQVRCRLWGKLEILGLATALKILFSVDGNGNGIGNGIGGNGNGNGVDKLSLQRNEVVALFNTLWRFSHALKTTAELVTLLEMNPSPDAPVIGAAPIASVSGGPAAAGSGGGGGGGDSGSGVGGAADTVPLQKTSLSIIDTCEFQRLRHIRQLGVCHYVEPVSQSHTRLEHSIGTSHLANEVVESLRRQQPELRINDDDVMASTCLDNAIFSRFCPGSDCYVLHSRLHHEKRSVELVDRVIDNNNIDIDPDTVATIKMRGGRSVQLVDRVIDNNNIDIDPDTVATIKDYKEKEFLWDIVANARTGIDVDKFDYLARDSYFCNIKACFDHKRIIQMMRVIDDEICFKYRELETVNDLFWLRAKMLQTVNELFWLCAKIGDMETVNELFWLRAKMYRNVYTHKTVKAVEAMILEALTHASHVFRFEEIALTKDLDRFCQLDDTICGRSCVHERGRGPIGRSSPLQEALVCLPALCLLLFDLLPSPPSPPPSPHSVCSCLTSSLRPLPLLPPLQYMNEFVVPVDALHHFRKLTVDELLQHNLTVDALAEHGTGSYLREHGDQVIVDNIKIDYGQDTDNPLDKVRFFDVSRGGCTSGSPSA